MKKKQIYNLIILDASGSMQSIYEEALAGLNKTLEAIRTSEIRFPEQIHFVSLVVFNSFETKEIMSVLPISQAQPISSADYVVKGMTPLYDAIGNSLLSIDRYIGKDDSVVVTIITDGEENASRIFSGKQVSSMVSELTDMRWKFTYIGANQDVIKQASAIAIKDVIEYQSTPQGTAMMFDVRCRALQKVYEDFADDMSNE